MNNATTLSQALLGERKLSRQIGMVVFGSLLITAAAQVSVPMYPVPMTLQTMAITLVGLTFGARLAAVTLLVYLAQGAMGLPVFAGGAAGLPYMFGTTGGFLIGFVGVAWFTGFLVERGLSQGVLRLFVAALVPAMLIYVPGVAWLWTITPLDLQAAIAAGATPFMLGDVIKSAVAAVIVAGGWQALRARKRD